MLMLKLEIIIFIGEKTVIVCLLQFWLVFNLIV